MAKKKTMTKQPMTPEREQPMSAAAYRKALASLEISQGRAGWLFGGKTQTSGRHWAAVGAPYHVALLLRLMKLYDLTPDDIDEIGAPYRKRNGV
jgi:hypothetical protein